MQQTEVTQIWRDIDPFRIVRCGIARTNPYLVHAEKKAKEIRRNIAKEGLKKDSTEFCR